MSSGPDAPPRYLVIAHRGASSYAPENTVAAFDLALEMGATVNFPDRLIAHLKTRGEP
jgi:glycerophosphoryl diester phosphodiesterase